ncbi:mitochondrial inner membrane protein required for protein import [Malassezia vespertilionis]|nr:mitochondrial inner membrane protein required for protein import [Malassezia vespertilionis]WFD07504.1 mitochondrial inner membrane protein required for protein import [Malassezia vespertilionis]
MRAFATDAKDSKGTGGQEPAANDKKPLSELPRGNFSLDIDTTSVLDKGALEAPKDGEGRPRTNAKARGQGTTSAEKSRGFMMRAMLIGSCFVGAYMVWTLGRDFDEHEHEIFHDKDNINSFIGRLMLRIQAMRETVDKPVWDKLLPDPLPFPYSRPYTLVVDLDQLLVASSWDTANGWRTAKRPGLDYFLGYLSQWYEIVLFTSQPFYAVDKMLEKLDPDRRYFAYQLFRESCRQNGGKLVKDISHLNRDPRKVIILDINPEHAALQPENAIIMDPWKGNKDDRELLALVPFLDAIGIYGVEDVRTTLKVYEGKHITTEHAKSEAMLKKRHEEEWQARKQRLGGLSSLFGSVSTGHSTKEPPKTLLETERARFHQGYLEDMRFWKENGEKLRKEMLEEQEKQLQQMKMNAWDGVARIFGGGAGTPPPPQEEPARA